MSAAIAAALRPRAVQPRTPRPHMNTILKTAIDRLENMSRKRFVDIKHQQLLVRMLPPHTDSKSTSHLLEHVGRALRPCWQCDAAAPLSLASLRLRPQQDRVLLHHASPRRHHRDSHVLLTEQKKSTG